MCRWRLCEELASDELDFSQAGEHSKHLVSFVHRGITYFQDSNLLATLTANTCLIVNGLKGRCDQAGQRRLIQQWTASR